MEIDEQIRQRLIDMATKVGPMQTIIAKVKSVDEDEKSCVITETIGDDELDIPDVRLRPVNTDGDGIVIFPKVDSFVLAGRIENDEQWIILMVDEADKLRWKIGSAELTINDNFLMKVGQSEFKIDGGFSIKKSTETLKKIMDDLIDAIEQITVTCASSGSPSTVPINIAAFSAIKIRVANLLN